MEHTGEQLEKSDIKNETLTILEPLQKPGMIEAGRVQAVELLPGGGGVVKETGRDHQWPDS